MKKSDLLKQQAAEKRERVQALYTAANKEGEVRNYTEQEQAEVNNLLEEIRSLETQITLEESIEEEMRKNAAAKGRKPNAGPAGGEAKEKEEMRKDYSLLKAVREMAGPGLTGVEKELHEEGVKNSRSAGVSVQGLALPNFIWNGTEERAVSSGNSAAALTEPYGGFIEALRTQTVVGQLGARTMGNLSGEVVMPNMTAGAATWEGETDQNADSGASFGGKKMTPNRLSAYVDVSKQFLNQASFDAEAMLRQDLTLATAIAVDAAAINGSGSGEPTGILNTAGIGSVAMGANGGQATWAKIVALESAVNEANVIGNKSYLTSFGQKGSWKTTSKDSGSGQFIWTGNEVNGYRAAGSNNVPTDLDKGTSTGVCHAAIFGDFSQLIIGQWGGVDVVVDQYTLARTGQVRLVVNGYFDVLVRHAGAFAAIKDLLV